MLPGRSPTSCSNSGCDRTTGKPYYIANILTPITPNSMRRLGIQAFRGRCSVRCQLAGWPVASPSRLRHTVAVSRWADIGIARRTV
jgi:hypothetical protein